MRVHGFDLRFGWTVFLLAGSLLSAPPRRKLRLHRVWQQAYREAIVAMDAGGTGFVATASTDLQIEVRSLETGKLVHDFQLAGGMRADSEPVQVRFSPDGKFLAISYLSQIRLYDIATWRMAERIGDSGEAAADPTGNIVWLGPNGNHRASSPSPVLAPRSESSDSRTRVVDFAFTPGSRYILAAYTRARCIRAPVGALACSSTGHDPIRLWDVKHGTLVWETNGDTPMVADLVSRHAQIMVPTLRVMPSPNGDVFAAAVGYFASIVGHHTETQEWGATINVGDFWNYYDTRVEIHSGLSGDRLYGLPEIISGTTPDIAFGPHGDSFFTEWTSAESSHGKARMTPPRWAGHLTKYRTSDGKPLCIFKNIYANPDVISHDRRWIIGLSPDRWGLKLGDAQSCRTIGSVRFALGNWWNHPEVTRIRIASDDRWVVAAFDKDFPYAGGQMAIYRVEQ